jgi:hypothetical protein
MILVKCNIGEFYEKLSFHCNSHLDLTIVLINLLNIINCLMAGVRERETECGGSVRH